MMYRVMGNKDEDGGIYHGFELGERVEAVEMSDRFGLFKNSEGISQYLGLDDVEEIKDES